MHRAKNVWLYASCDSPDSITQVCQDEFLGEEKISSSELAFQLKNGLNSIVRISKMRNSGVKILLSLPALYPENNRLTGYKLRRRTQV